MLSQHLSIPEKANRVLNVLLICFALIVVRIWHLTWIEHDAKEKEAMKPRERVVLQAPERGTIRDRFNIPLAINRISYHATVLYSQIKTLPPSEWRQNPDGTRTRHYPRKEHIANLAHLLGNELGMDPDRIEDLIHSKAALYHQMPFIVKENITEEQYYRLKMLEKDFVGLSAVKLPRRSYPQGPIAASVVGYMGAINKNEYESLVAEEEHLSQFLHDWEAGECPPLPGGLDDVAAVRRRYRELHDRAYHINDYVGKSGVESEYEEALRGFQGRRTYYADAQGNFLRELAGRCSPLPGKRLLLTLSLELQKYAEELLATNERIRDGRSTKYNAVTGTRTPLKQPWIKGGAIVAMDPKTGEILALASYPRFDPNDFVFTGDMSQNRKKRQAILQWFETESYLQDIFDGKRPLQREDFTSQGFVTTVEPLTWEKYLDALLPADNAVLKHLNLMGRLKHALAAQEAYDAVVEAFPKEVAPAYIINALYHTEGHTRDKSFSDDAQSYKADEWAESHKASLIPLKHRLDAFVKDLSHNYDKMLLLDLYRVAVDQTRFPEDLHESLKNVTLSSYHKTSGDFFILDDVVEMAARELFHDLDFRLWKEENGKEFLKRKRDEERAQGHWARPFVDLYDAEERFLFTTFWERHRWELIDAFLFGIRSEDAALTPYFDYLITLSQESREDTPWATAYQDLQESLQEVPPYLRIPYLATMRRCKELTRPLIGQYRHLRGYGKQQEKQLALAFYPKNGYGFARSWAFSQAEPQGSLFKLVVAYEALSQRYYRLLQEGSYDKSRLNPLEIVDYDNGSTVGTWVNGTAIPRQYKGGVLPRSHRRSPGHIDLVHALETSSNPYFALLAGDVIEDPDDLLNAARDFGFGSPTGIGLPGEVQGHLPDDLRENRTGLYSFAMGQHSLTVTPLQSAVMMSAIVNGGKVLKPKIVKTIAGRNPINDEEEVLRARQNAFQEPLELVGITFPLFTAAQDRLHTCDVTVTPSHVSKELHMPKDVDAMIKEGMKRVVMSAQAMNGGSLTTVYKDHPEALHEFLNMKDTLVGKTGTAEIVEHADLDLKEGSNIYNHIWFGGCSYKLDTPELVVIVMFRYGGLGKDAAPIAAQIVSKWRDINRPQ